ncbi:hypothetical protein [Marinobacter sp. BGYM27]|uniref:hypothetical protein n=1 Tax=Marinobacter sp. BGYM27 TaxID=2975597 RepID=UPI0021A4AF32|nr:hypothetical protein [Marinobacter sp. BGYM27]MDG5499126.1 hypothetical protein [Marinobacter sp. BGYM27]
MAFWQELIIQVIAVALTTLTVIALFFSLVVKPFLNRKVDEIRLISVQIDEKIREGVRSGVMQGLAEAPENTVRESTRAFLRMGSGLMENGLSSFLGGAEALKPSGAGGTRPR